jgi:multidrug efflux pump subunit AcrB
MKSFNLSDWALRHRSLIWYFIIICVVIGGASYLGLGREEDPNFTIKTMLVSASWPGASIDETLSQVTDRIEKKLQEIDTLDYTKSITSPGQTTVFVNLKDTARAADVPRTWLRVRNIMTDIKGDFPTGVSGPVFNDDFGDVFGNIYAFTADGLSDRQLRDYVEDARSKVLSVPNVGKVNLIGTQDEVIHLDISTRQIAALGLDRDTVVKALQAQNAVTPSGVIEAGPERISLRVSGSFASEASLRAVNLRINDRFFRLSDVATITRGYVDPPQPLFRFNGQPAIGLAIGMRTGGNLLAFGEALKAKMRQIEGDLPIGVGVSLVADQPQIVDQAVGGFVEALIEAVGIVLVVSFLSLGLRAGLVVAVAIPLVLAITFFAMSVDGISLQRISLGALIIALGLLVDDAMIAVEMMVARLEAGEPITQAATAVYTHTAFPMLTGTLVTVCSFIPVGLNGSSAGEYTRTLFVVIAVALTVSWLVAVLFTPLLGVTILPRQIKRHTDGPDRIERVFARILVCAMRWRWLTIGATLAVFALSVYSMRFVQQQFFPSSDRPELILDWMMPQNASITETRAQMDRFEAQLGADQDIVRWSSYVGQGAIRFVLSFDVQPNEPYFGQMVIVTRDLQARERVRARIAATLARNFTGMDVYVHTLEMGPPVGRPIAYRIGGPDTVTVRQLSQQLAAIVGGNPHVGSVVYDWNEPARVVRVDVLQDKARQLGVSSEDIATTLGGLVGGDTVTQVRDGIYLVDVAVRAREAERASINTIQDLQLPGRNGQAIPLAAIATFQYGIEQPVVWRRDRLPTVTIKGAIIDETQPATVVAALRHDVDAFANRLPPGYGVETGGAVEESGKGQGPIAAVVPVMLFAMATILMIQLQSFSRLFLVATVAPLGLIGVVAALLPSGAPLGFVAILGVLALIGILIRNSVILVVQIEEVRREGRPPWEAVVEATQHRMRPILLTAAAASLALIPISREVFWGPMAFAMMGGIIVGTVLTLLLLPALYVAWFKISEPREASERAA